MTQPAISIVIPAYNRAALLPRAIESVISQTFREWEIVLVDDGSTDGTPDLAKNYQQRLGDRLLFLRQANTGASAARNRGIGVSRGRFVCFLDSDDEFLPHKLSRQLELFERRPELGFVYSDYAFVDLGGERHESAFQSNLSLARFVPHRRIAENLCLCSSEVFDVLLRGYFIATIVGMVRREVLGDRIRFAENLSYAEEWLFHLQIVRSCRVGFVDEPLCLHHHTRGSAARSDRSSNALRYRQTLRAIRDVFAGQLTTRQRCELRRQLAQASDQLGYNADRAGAPFHASRCFFEAMQYRPTWRRAGRCLGELMRGILQRKVTSVPMNDIQESHVVVR